MTSLNTQNSYRDEHLGKPEFFDNAKFKKATFEASEIVKDTAMGVEHNYIAKGKLTIKGVAKDAELYFNYLGFQTKDNDDGKVDVAGFEGKSVINRVEYGIGESGGIGDNVKIVFTIEAAQPKK